MANGYTGKILKINLTTKEIGKLDTAQYEEFGGGVGMGAAIFWDLAVMPGDWDLQDAFDPMIDFLALLRTRPEPADPFPIEVEQFFEDLACARNTGQRYQFGQEPEFPEPFDFEGVNP